MKRIVVGLFLFVGILLIPNIVLAEEYNVEIKSIDLIEKK